ncbi:MAG TPA: MBL fold metallo-hydrolase [Desulforhopalus sp.]|nr:MBL fold metallo-hydrolase [Desulforhopalus sp.]
MVELYTLEKMMVRQLHRSGPRRAITLRRLCTLGLVGLLLGGCGHYSSGPVTDHFDGRRFYNPGKPLEKNFGDFLKWRLTSEKKPWPPFSELPVYDRPPPRVNGAELRVSYVGHASVLLQTAGLNILLDPVWSERASPFSWAGPRRVHPPGVALADLPPIDLLLISHNHYDHLDLSTISQMWQRDQPRIIVPLGNETIIVGHDRDIRVEAYDWGEQVAAGDGVSVHLEPMHHWSARGLLDRNRALWAAFVLTTPGGNIALFADSGYGGGDTFRAARDKFGGFRLALLPIGAYEPRWFMEYGHMNPQEVLQAYLDLGRPRVLPTHHRMFPLADDGYDQPMTELKELLTTDQVALESFVFLQAGESWWVP